MSNQFSKNTKASVNSANRLAACLFFFLTIIFLIFIMVASWTPGSGYTHALRSIEDIRFIRFHPLKHLYAFHDLRDITTNVLLYIPLGVLLSLSVSAMRPRFVTPWVLVGPAVSLVMETIQYFLGRFPDQVDMMTNTVGFLLGFWMIVVAMKWKGLKPAAMIGLDITQTRAMKVNSIAAIRFLYICIYMIAALLPFDISVSVTKIYEKLLADAQGQLRIIFDPFYHFYRWPGDWGNVLLELLGLTPVALLKSLEDGFKGRLNGFSAVSICVGLAFLSEVSQIFVLSRSSDIIMLPLAVVAGLAGWGAARVWFGLQRITAFRDQATSLERQKIIPLVIGVYIVFICLVSWAPYRFEYHPKMIAKKILNESNWIPFKAHFSARTSPIDLVKEPGLFVPLGLLVTLWMQNFRRCGRLQIILLTAIFCGLLAAFVELTQAACLGRYLDVTDIFLAILGGILGRIMFRLFSFNINVQK